MLKPIDIHNAEFKRTFKGYNEEEVDAFLAKIVGEYDSLWQQNKQLSGEVEQLKTSLRASQNKEQDIHALISITKETVTEVKQVANQQAKAVVAEAQAQAQRIIAEAKAQAQQELSSAKAEEEAVQVTLNQLVAKENALKDRMRHLMETFSAMLEDVDADKSGENLDDTRVYGEAAVTDGE